MEAQVKAQALRAFRLKTKALRAIAVKTNAIRAVAWFFCKTLLLFLAVSLAAFTLLRLSPIDPVQAYIGADASVSNEQKARIAERWGLNEAPHRQYLKWLGNICRGDFGESVIFRLPVLTVVKERALASFALMGFAWLFSGAAGFLLGVLAGTFHGKWPDKLITTWCLILASAPTFWLALVLLIIFSVSLGIFPLGLAAPAGKLAAEVSFGERIHHLVLPCLALALSGVSYIAMQTRQKLCEVLEQDYVIYARARGETQLRIILRHGLRNIALPALTLQFLSFSELFGGSVLAEQVFAYPGLGRTAVMAGMQSDAPLLLGITLFSALFVFTGNTIANSLYHIINPEVKKHYD
ncbi:MAG: ABC transporter permease [Termitinemataceae bacterium]|nr:MAG: ABC transporter permease [Termitinemataceae bacterium]